MMEYPIQAEIVKLLTAVKNYFRSQQELYGVDLYLQKATLESMVPSDEQRQYQLNRFFEEIKDCQRCELAGHRTKLVFGSGNPNSKIMLIGEAPGYHEDVVGKPFVGNAGQLLDKILKAIELSREEIYITNVVKCRPPQNRDPLPNECQSCHFILQKQLEIIKPNLLLILGRIAARVVLNTEDSITNLRGRVHNVAGTKAVVTYHPAALLRNPGLKRDTWEDVQLFQQLYQ